MVAALLCPLDLKKKVVLMCSIFFLVFIQWLVLKVDFLKIELYFHKNHIV